jgi:putative membrane protein
MIQALVHLLVTAGLLMIVAKVIDGIDIEGATPAIIGALVLGLANVFVRPLAVLLTLPLTILTLGLFIIVINAAMLMLVAAIVPGFRVKGFKQGLLGALLLSVLNWAVSAVFS